MNNSELANKHLEEWAHFRSDVLDPLYDRVAGGDEKNAKTLADVLKITHEGERKALAFKETGEPQDTTMEIGFME